MPSINKEFPIRLVTNRSSAVSQVAFFLLVLGIIGLIIFYLEMFPSERSSLELRTLWFIEGVPLWVKQLTLYSIAILVLVVIMRVINTRSKSGTLIVRDEQLEIFTKRKQVQLTFDEIKEVAFVAGVFGRDSFKIFFKTKGNKIVQLKLHNLLADELTDSLKKLATKNVKVLFDSTDPYWPDE